MAGGTQFVIIGDTHLGPGPRQADRLQALDTIILEGLALPRLGAWLWPGDLFHAGSTIEDRNILAERLQRMANLAPVFIVEGNHERKGDLDVFARIGAAHRIVVATTPGVFQVTLATGEGLAVFALPYPRKGTLIGAGVAVVDVHAAARAALEPIFREGAARLAELAAGQRLPLFLGHVNIGGAVASTGQPQIGQEIELDPELLARLGNIPKIVGHIHKGQTIHGAIYPGSICRLDYGEVEPKRWLLLEYAGPGDFTIAEQPLEVPGLWHVAGTLGRDGLTWKATKGPDGDVVEAPASWAGQDVKAVFRYPQSEREVLQRFVPEIEALFAEARLFKYELVAVPDRALRAPEVAAARTMPERVEAWAKVTGETLPAHTLDRLPLLEHEDEEAVRAQAGAWADALLEGEREPEAVAS